jgi:hypothetical protein
MPVFVHHVDTATDKVWLFSFPSNLITTQKNQQGAILCSSFKYVLIDLLWIALGCYTN